MFAIVKTFFRRLWVEPEYNYFIHNWFNVIGLPFLFGVTLCAQFYWVANNCHSYYASPLYTRKTWDTGFVVYNVYFAIDISWLCVNPSFLQNKSSRLLNRTYLLIHHFIALTLAFQYRFLDSQRTNHDIFVFIVIAGNVECNTWILMIKRITKHYYKFHQKKNDRYYQIAFTIIDYAFNITFLYFRVIQCGVALIYFTVLQSFHFHTLSILPSTLFVVICLFQFHMTYKQFWVTNPNVNTNTNTIPRNSKIQ